MNKLTLRRRTGWVIFVAFLALMLTPTIVTPARGFLMYFRWVPLAALCLLALVLSIRLRSLPRPLYRADAIVLAIIGLAFFSAIYSIDPQITIARAFTLLLVYGALFWGVWIYADASGAENVIRFPVLAAAVAFALHIAVSPFLPNVGFPYYGRFAGWAENPGTVGALVALTLPFVLWCTIESQQRRYKVLIGVMLIALTLSQARVEAIAALVGSGYFLWRALPRRRLLLLAAVAVFVGVFLLWGYVGVGLLVPHVLSGVASPTETGVASPTETGVASPWQLPADPRYSIENIQTLSGRVDKWAVGLNYLRERPLLGFGFGTEDRLFGFHGVDSEVYRYTGAYFHNSYLGLAVQLGLVGLVLLYTPLLFLVMREIRADAAITRQNLVRSALLGVVLSGMSGAFFSSWLYSMGNANALPFWISVMLLVRHSGQVGLESRIAVIENARQAHCVRSQI